MNLTNLNENLYVDSFVPAEQIYVEQYLVFHLTKVPKLRSDVTKRINKKIRELITLLKTETDPCASNQSQQKLTCK